MGRRGSSNVLLHLLIIVVLAILVIVGIAHLIVGMIDSAIEFLRSLVQTTGEIITWLT